MPPLSSPMHGTPAFRLARTSQTVSPANTACPGGAAAFSSTLASVSPG
jgi:hypothetical protein